MSKKNNDLISVTSYIKAKWEWNKVSTPYSCDDLSEQIFLILDGDDNNFSFKKYDEDTVYIATLSTKNDKVLIRKQGMDIIHRMCFNY